MDNSTQSSSYWNVHPPLPAPAPAENGEPQTVLSSRDAKHLKELGLLSYAPAGFCGISLDIMHATTYPKKRHNENKYFGFWRKLPPELQLAVMDKCRDEEIMSLGMLSSSPPDFHRANWRFTARTSKRTRRLAEIIVEKRQERFARLPIMDQGLATLKYLGYTDWKAIELWADWEPLAFLDERGFLAHCLSPLWSISNEEHADALDDSDDWRAIMSHWGVSRECQDAILDPAFSDIRLTQSAAYWVCKTVELRWSTLRYIQRASWHRANPRKILRVRPGLLEQPPGPHRYYRQFQHQKEKEVDMTVLYKAIDVWTVYNVFMSGLKPLLSLFRLLEQENEEWTVDFSCWEVPFTLYPSRLLAEKFARYSARRSRGYSPAALLKVCITTKTLKDKLKIKAFGDGEGKGNEEEWKKVVWINRVEEDPAIDVANGVPNPVADMWGLDLVVGKVSCNKGKAIVKMASWEEISGDNVLMVDGGGGLETAVQYSFLGEDCFLELDMDARLEIAHVRGCEGWMK